MNKKDKKDKKEKECKTITLKQIAFGRNIHIHKIKFVNMIHTKEVINFLLDEYKFLNKNHIRLLYKGKEIFEEYIHNDIELNYLIVSAACPIHNNIHKLKNVCC